MPSGASISREDQRVAHLQRRDVPLEELGQVAGKRLDVELVHVDREDAARLDPGGVVDQVQRHDCVDDLGHRDCDEVDVQDVALDRRALDLADHRVDRLLLALELQLDERRAGRMVRHEQLELVTVDRDGRASRPRPYRTAGIWFVWASRREDLPTISRGAAASSLVAVM